jgi:hypothetical protein
MVPPWRQTPYCAGPPSVAAEASTGKQVPSAVLTTAQVPSKAPFVVPEDPATPQRLMAQPPSWQLVCWSGQLAVEVQAYSQRGPKLGSGLQVKPAGQREAPNPASQSSNSFALMVVVQAVTRPLLLPLELLPELVPPVELLEPDDELPVAAPELVPEADWQWPLTSQVWPVVHSLGVLVQLAMQVPVWLQTSAVLPLVLQAAS